MIVGFLMVKVKRYGLMELGIWGNGMKTKCRDLVDLLILIEIFMKGNLLLTRPMARVNIFSLLVKFMRDIGLMTSLTDKESKHFKMALFMMVNSEMVQRMDMEFIFGLINQYIEACGKIMNLMAEENINGLMAENTLVNGRKT